MFVEVYVLVVGIGGTLLAGVLCQPIIKGYLAEVAEKERASW